MVKKLLGLKNWFFIFTLLFLGEFTVYANAASAINGSFSLLKTKTVVNGVNNSSNTYGGNFSFSNNLSFVNYLWADTPTAEEGFKKVFQNLEVVLLKGEVLKDALAPSVSCKDITVYLDATGNVSILEDAVNDGSTGVGPLTFDTDIIDFTCADIGIPVGVTLTVTDTDDGLTNTCNATVTVVDNQNPAITTLGAISVNADAGVCTYASS
ncbi:MAG: hypothetical protein CVT98_05935, partial [Bacteroidetes bacterium HGW-Bacteroidetes-15]